MKKLLIIPALLNCQLLFGQYLLTDGSNHMTGGLNIQREGYSSIELKSNTGSFIDFHSTITSDFDGRIIWNYNNSGRFNFYGTTQFNNEILSPILRLSYKITMPESFTPSDPTIGLSDNSGFGINIHKTNGIGFSFNNEHKVVIDPSGSINWGTSGASLSTSQGAAIELRGTGIPHIDFSNDATTDYDIRMILKSDNFLQIDGGSVGIGTSVSGSHKLAVEGSIGAREIKVEASGWSDFVFENNYELRTLEEVEEHINENGHLPEIPSEDEVAENGINLGEMDAKLLQKIEELTLYMIQMNKEMAELKAKNEQLVKEVSALKNE